ncbi:MAG: histidine triad nucleotide-binding protein [Chloroflexi bacterium RBG_13_46_14]|nr:MAG: histidine triad nucleotide-binding protein [Chloroflexi bacterium RBG_13_46_14]
MDECIFCKIIAGDIPSDVLYRDDEVIAFRDVNPVAPTHILILPVEHLVTTLDIPDDNASLAGKMIQTANRLANQEGISKNGYRLVINCGKLGGQVVGHLHMHLIGGRQLSSSLG